MASSPLAHVRFLKRASRLRTAGGRNATPSARRTEERQVEFDGNAGTHLPWIAGIDTFTSG
jgi:hypothetical protein